MLQRLRPFAHRQAEEDDAMGEATTDNHVPSSSSAGQRSPGQWGWGPRVLRAAVAVFALCVGGLGGEALIRARLDALAAGTPTRVYAQPLVVHDGMPIEGSTLQGYLEQVGYERVRRRPRRAGEFRLSSRRWEIEQRTFRHLGHVLNGGAVRIELRRGRVVDIDLEDEGDVPYVVLEPPLLRTVAGADGEDRVPVPLNQIPEALQAAVLAVEDRRFYDHHGIDLPRIAGAALANLKARRLSQGASTVTQQLVKNRFLSPRRTIMRKVRELAMSLVLEMRYSKQEILEAYLNEVYFGQDGRLAVHGVGRASQFYFGRDVEELDLHRVALLAGMIRGPSFYNPRRNPDRARERRDLVLRLMWEQNLLDEDDYEEATERSLGLGDPTHRVELGRHFTDYVLQTLEARLGPEINHGHAVFTSLDPALQRHAEEAVREGLRALEQRYRELGEHADPLEAALVAMDPRSGAILAMVGGREYSRSQFNRAVLARRQPGSAFKPVVALTALQRDATFTLATTIADEPLSVDTPAGEWRPVNYDERFRGPVTLRDALERSLNVPMARVGLAVGPKAIVTTARQLGIDGPMYAVPSLALGASEVTPLELTGAFAVFAAEGVRHDPYATLGVLTPAATVIETPEEGAQRVAGEDVTYLVTSALEGAVERGTGRGIRRAGYRGDVAGKSGTTNDFRDAWFVGYTPTIAIGVWVGFDDGTPVGLPGARAALPIFADFLLSAKGRYGDADFRVPRGLEVVEIDPETGLRAGPGCRGRPEVFLSGTAPRERCSPYRFSWSDGAERSIATIVELLRRRFERGRN